MDATSPIPNLQQCRDTIEQLTCVVIARMMAVPTDPPGPDILPNLDRLTAETTPTTRPLLKAGIEAARSRTSIIDTCPTDKALQLAEIAEKYHIIGRTWDRLGSEITQALSMLALSRAMTDRDPARIVEAWQSMTGISPAGCNSKYSQAMIHGSDLMDAFQKTLTQSWLIRNTWPESSNLVVIWGSYATYKSFLGLDIIVCLAAGIPYHGLETRKQRVVYLAAEGQSGIIRRIVGLMVHYGLDSLDNLTVLPMPCLLDDGQQLGELIAALRGMPEAPEVIVFDTLARSMGGDENETAAMNKVVQACDRLRVEVGCRTMIIHHAGKDGARGSRGAISLPAATDTEIKIEKAGQYMARMICLKQKDYQEFEPRTYRLEPQDTGYLDEDLQPVTTLVPVYDPDATIPTDRPTISGSTRIALDALRSAISDQGQDPTREIFMKQSGQTRLPVVHEDVWRDVAYKMGISSGAQKAKRTAFSRARQTLLDQGMICTWDGYYWIPGGNNHDK